MHLGGGSGGNYHMAALAIPAAGYPEDLSARLSPGMWLGTTVTQGSDD